ncbi:sensor of ECF-type sigma factor [Flavobacterium macrobrachii]|jgi:Spy/CpxP family protein refolding chaperone|uniref:Sensor of ECF-type sigma factor n=1 Tax=Flavobacterium macrobrachii TaxID=591204 RepID=A0ABS2CZY3_9FLAO|nr:sensor of ECF-type sigma factor [Flavobacterium macrobrachii]MBM6499752.1 sensor of ECF-type sigma factor [Flavobacterium macrobrachii]PZO28875.1 MAG: sensor of ECF-type sigma factor [Flavobacteriaceae bacterium]
MKIKSLIIIIITLTSTFSFAQNGRLMKQKKEQVKSLKVAFITSELDLTADESVKFWPLYNAFDEKQSEIRRTKMKSYLDRMDSENFDTVSEKEAATLLSQMESSEEELHQLRKKFISNLKSVIPAVKILKLKKAEEDFNRKLLQQYRNKRNR